MDCDNPWSKRRRRWYNESFYVRWQSSWVDEKLNRLRSVILCLCAVRSVALCIITLEDVLHSLLISMAWSIKWFRIRIPDLTYFFHKIVQRDPTILLSYCCSLHFFLLLNIINDYFLLRLNNILYFLFLDTSACLVCQCEESTYNVRHYKRRDQLML